MPNDGPRTRTPSTGRRAPTEVAASGANWPEPVRPPAGSPNVLVVLFDDVGFSDFGCYGSEIDTPTLDALAARGLRYNSFHTTAMCSTTRAALLTGRNHHSVGVGCLANFDSGYPGYRGKIEKSAITLPEVLRSHGYRNYMIGKWHVTRLTEGGPTGPFDGWPLGRGYDRFYGFLDAETDQYSPELVRDNTHVTAPGDYDSGYHLTEDLIDNAIRMLSEHRAILPDIPWHCWIALGACHAPHQVPRSFVDKYEAVFAKGWDRTRADRLAKQKSLGIVPSDVELPPLNDFVRPWDDLSANEQRLNSRLQAAYAGMLDHADTQLARVVDFLEKSGQLDNTLIVALSDNGASQEGGPLGFVNAMSTYNGIVESLEDKLRQLDDIGGPNTHSNFPWGWATAANTPLRRYKQNTHGGGIRDPFVVSWPGRITDHGAIRTNFCHATDLLPTLLESLDLAVPVAVNGIEVEPLEGVSFASTFARPPADNAVTPTEKSLQYFEMFGHRGIWHDGWKAVAFHPAGSSFDDDVWELYHLDSDFNERFDLASSDTARLARMQELWWEQAEKYKVLPLDDRFAPRFAENAERHLGNRNHFVFWNGMGHVPGDLAPDLRSRSYTITAHVDLDRAAKVGELLGDPVQGVLISHGDSTSGYSLFVRDGHLEHDLNIGGSHQRLRSTTPVPKDGKCTLGFSMRRNGEHGVATMLIDGEPAGSFETADIFRLMISWSGLDIGLDRGTPVSDYPAPFAFTRWLERVEVDLGSDQQVDAAAAAAVVLARE